MKKIFLSTLLFIFAALLYSTPQVHASALNFEPLARCCLPERGRMQKSGSDACHCPPQSLCPTSIKEWNTSSLLPPIIRDNCCEMPKVCTITRQNFLACGQTSRITEDKTVSYCFRYETTSKNRTSPLHKEADTKMMAIEAEIIKFRDELRTLSAGTQTQATYDRGLAVFKLIEGKQQELAKIEFDINKLDSKLDLKFSCLSNTEAKCCTQNISQPCPTQKCMFTPSGWSSLSPAEKQEAIDKCPTLVTNDCVAEGTLVAMADGTQKKIQDIKIGDFVKGYNANNRVTGLSLEEEGINFLMSINEGKLNITAQHPILTTNGWKAISPELVEASIEFKKEITKLEVGDEIVVPDETTFKVKTIGGYVGPKVPTYNLSVNGDKTFIANGLVVRGYNKFNAY